MNKRAKKKFWENVEQYGSMLEMSYELMLLIDIEDGSCQVASFSQKRFNGILPEDNYPRIYASMYEKVDLRDREIFSKCSMEQLKKFGKEKINCKLVVPYRYIAEEEVWMENVIIREFLSDSVLLLLVREISDSVLQARGEREKADFLLNLSQDILTPLYTVRELGELCRQHADNAVKVREYMDKQQIGIEQIMSVAKDLAGMVHSDTGRADIRTEAFSLTELVKDIVIILQQRCVRRGVHFQISYQRLRHEELVGDDMKISRILLNIMSNILRYSRFGDELLFQVLERESEREDVASLEFRMIHNEEKMLQEYKELLDDTETQNDIWYQEGNSQSELGMTRDMIHAMGGEMFCNVQLGVTGVFFVRLDLRINTHKAVIRKIPECEGRRVLVADDDEHMLNWMKEILSMQGIETVIAHGSREAVNIAYESVKNNLGFDLIILSWKMKDMDGLQATELMRKILGFGIPIVMQTAYEWSEIEFEARSVGVNYFTTKPLTISTLLPIFEQLNASVEQIDGQEQIPNFKGRHILLAEPDKKYREIIEECLKDVSLSYEVVYNGKQVVETMMIAEDNEYDLILMEINMPQLNGYDVTRMIRRLQGEYVKKVPIIALSSSNQREDQMKLAAAGLNGQIKKPIELHDLYETLRGYLQ